MKLVTSILLLILLLAPVQPAFAARPGANTVTLTASQVDGANDIEAAIIQATADGKRPGTVILDGSEGPFVYTDLDRSLNLWISNLTLRGINNAILSNCDGGLSFDDLPMQGHGIILGGASSGWEITGNLVQAGGDAIRIYDASDMLIAGNHLSGTIGVALFRCSQMDVRNNAIQAAWQGVLLGQEAWENSVQINTILGVEQSGVSLEPDVTGNRIVANRVLCAPGASCLTVDASGDSAEYNLIAGNKP
ncbi:MAG: right-handed parallel beta-helix repeat-containing protein [Anaerolineales bacterium]|nr:right-handed parallel beta-helix repeat-containing protein [Anaerolineales bacterium]